MVRKKPVLSHFYTKNDHFAKTGLGTNIGNVDKKVFFAGAEGAAAPPRHSWTRRTRC